MQFDKIKVSSRTTHLFGMLKNSTGIGSESWGRLSLCLSIKQKGIPNPDEYNKSGTEFLPSQLFFPNYNMYLALMINRLRQDNLNPKLYLTEMTRSHLNRGAISVKQRINNMFDIYNFLTEMQVAESSSMPKGAK
ncbi:MAG: DndE family protein [Candidatus Nitrosoabyssus spongiisocia]|nr:MAG: DndE family protein [Nitrosopumilaceae archaeon AB1(1)]